MNRFTAFCVLCTRSARSFTNHYRDFLLDPGTLFTLAGGFLLTLAVVFNPLEIISDHAPQNGAHWVYLAAALVGSSYIWWSAIRGIREGDFTADIPVSLATLAAILIGQYAAAAVVAVLLLLWGMLEDFVAARAGHALEDLARLLPNRVTVRRPEGDVIVPLEAVQVGEIILVRPGERVAVDGDILSGTASVNQAAITGESIPIEKKVGDRVFAGSLNENGAVEVLTTQVGERTTLGQIRHMVLEAQENKAPIERILNRYAKFYTPAAILVGLILWSVTGDVLRAITVLIVFCPCVMVLATPTALVASIGNAALRGSLVKRGATIETLAKVNMIIFDKTGTLTSGKPNLVDVISLDGILKTQILQLAAGAEKFSEHPLGQSVLRAALQQSLEIADPESFEVMPGAGVRAKVGEASVLIGKPQLLTEWGVDIHDAVREQVDNIGCEGRMVSLAAVDLHPCGLLVFEACNRPEGRPTIRRLQQMGLRTVLLTGDHSQTAQRVAHEMGIGEVYAEVLPRQKVEIVKKSRARSR